jgi:putative salt-induced outer membrane protein YdiY
MNMKKLKKTVLLLMLFSPTVFADTVTMKNGDVLTGKIIKKDTDKLVFKTPYTGNIKITWSEIKSLSSDQPVKMVLADESSFSGLLTASDAGHAKIKLADLNTTTDIDLKDLTYINPSPEVYLDGVVWKGHLDIGGAITQGNTDTSSVRLEGETVARTKHNRYTLGGEANRSNSSGVNTASNSKGAMKYDRFLSKQWYLYANSTLENDKFRDISMRATAGLGTGYQIYEQPDLNLSVEGGLDYVKVDYVEAPDAGYVSGRWALKYDQLLFSESIRFFHQDEIIFRLNSLSDSLLYTKTGLRMPIANNINATTQINIDYDNNPRGNRAKLDKTLLFSLGYGW